MQSTTKNNNSEIDSKMSDTPAELPQFNLNEKKKSKTKRTRAKKQVLDATSGATTGDGTPAAGGSTPAPASGEAPAAPALVDEGEDYSCDVLLRRLYEQVEKGKAKPPPSNRPPLEPPIALRFGGARTVWSNFSENCAAVNRPLNHVLAFTLTELGTTGSIGEGGRLTVRGIFRKEHFASIIRKYIQEYVVCPVCKSKRTVMEKEKRLLYTKCEVCNSRTSVVRIKAAFVAETKATRKKDKESK